MSVQRMALPDPKLVNELCATIFDDFTHYTSAGGDFTTYSLGGAGTAAWSGTAIDTNSGASDTVLCTTHATALDVEGLYQTNPNMLPIAANSAIYAEGYIHAVGVHAAGTAIEYFGVASTHVLATTGAAGDPTASYSGALIYKLSGDTYWRTQLSNGNTKVTTLSNVPVVEGSNKFRIDIIAQDGGNVKASFKVNNVILTDANGNQINPTVPFAALAAMGLVALIESDANAAAQTGYIDYLASGRYRALLNG